MTKVKSFFASFLILGLAVVICQSAYSQDLDHRHRPRKKVGVLFETLEEEVKQSLIELKREDPEKFRMTVKEVLEERRKELKKLKEENPQEFKEIITEAERKLKERIKQRLRRKDNGELFEKKMGKKDHPGKQEMHKMILFETLSTEQKEKIINLRNKYREKLETVIKNRIKQLEEIRNNNPEKFEEIMEEAKDKVRARMKQQKEQHPQRFEKFRRMNPGYLKEKMEWLREEDPELYRYIMEKAKRGQESEYYPEREGQRRPYEPELRKPLFDN